MQPTLKLSAIVSGPNHRQYFDPQAMKELEAGIRAAGGVTQPILVRPHPEREGLFEIMAGLPVTIRLLDPPLHEFLPHTAAEIAAVAADLGTTQIGRAHV